MPALKVYAYNWATGEYIGEDYADVSPLEPGTFHIPAYSTPKAPPDVQPGQRAVFDRDQDAWSVEPITAQSVPEPEDILLVDDMMTIGDLFDAQQ